MDKISILKKADISVIEVFFLFAFSAAGLFNEFLCCFAAALLLIYLTVEIFRRESFTFYLNTAFFAVCSIVLLYFLSSLWAVDSGEAFIGGLKFLPLFLTMLIVMGKEKNPLEYLDVIPFIAVSMTVISTVLSFIPVVEDYVEIAGRLCGFFQYSNTFALFLLIALIITATKEKHGIQDLVFFGIYVFGILYSGSRTVFILLAVTVLALVVFSKNKKLKISVIAVTLAVLGVGAVVALVTDNFYSIGRFLTVSLKESTFVGRLLYYSDALPVILKHPLGLGFKGYYYMQGSFQTGLYSVMNVHNDFLQILLDIGWLPFALLVGAIIKSFLKKGSSLRKRLLLFVICAHSFFDFDLQYVSMFIILIMSLELKEGREVEFSVKKPVFAPVTLALTLLSLYFGVALAFSYFGKTEIVNKLYPSYTSNSIMLLIESESPSEMEKIADRIISGNEYVSVAYSAKARVAFSKGDIISMINYKEKAIERAVLSYDEYLDYCSMLIHAYSLYSEANDAESAQVCAQKIITLRKRLNENGEKLSTLGKQITDQPTIQFPDDVNEYIDELERVYSED